MLEREAVVPAAAVDRGEVVEARLLLGGGPGRLVEGVVGLVVPALIEQRQAEVDICLAVIRVGVALGHARDGRAEVLLRPGEQAAAQQQRAVGVVHADVARVALQRFEVVRVGQVRRVAVLLDVQAGQVELLVGENLLRQLRGGRRIGNLVDLLRLRRVVEQLPAIRVVHGQHERRLRHVDDDAVAEHVHRADRRRPVVDGPAVRGEHHARVLVDARGVDGDVRRARPALEVQHDLGARVFDVARGLVGHEVLGEGLLLKGLQPREVRLVVAEHAGHQLDVRAVFVGQVAVPRLAEVAAAPGPLLLAGGDVVVGDVQDARAHAVIIAADEVVIAVRAHVARGDGDVPVAGDVHARAVIVLVVDARGDREGGDVALAVVIDGAHVRREDGLRVVIDGHSGVGPPQERLRQARAVVELAANLDIGAVGVDGKGHLALRAVHLVDLGELDRAAAVLVFGDAPVGRRIGRRAVVLRPVELDAAGNPRADEAHQRRLDDLVVVDEVVAVGLVVGALDAAAQLRQHHHADVVVLQPHRGIGLIDLLVEDLVDDGQRIHLAAGALIDALFEEHGVLVRLADAIGGQHDLLHPDFSVALNVFHSSILLPVLVIICVCAHYTEAGPQAQLFVLRSCCWFLRFVRCQSGTVSNR